MTDPKTKKDFTAIVDFKSGRKGFFEEHELQLHLYRSMWDVNFPDKPMQRLFNFSPKDWRKAPSYNLKDQTDSVNAKKIPALLALAGIEDEKRDNTLTIVHGVLDLDHGKIADNVLSLSLSELIKSKAEKKEAPKQAAAAPEKEEKPQTAKKATKKAVETKEAQKPTNSPSMPGNAVKNEISDKLPWEDEMDMKIEETPDGVKVSATIFEPAEREPNIEADKKAIEVLEQAAKENLLNFEMEL